MNLDTITRTKTGFVNFADLIDSANKSSYRPSMDQSDADMVALADAYDAAMARRCDARRAYRYGVAVVTPKESKRLSMAEFVREAVDSATNLINREKRRGGYIRSRDATVMVLINGDHDGEFYCTPSKLNGKAIAEFIRTTYQQKPVAILLREPETVQFCIDFGFNRWESFKDFLDGSDSYDIEYLDMDVTVPDYLVQQVLNKG